MEKQVVEFVGELVSKLRTRPFVVKNRTDEGWDADAPFYFHANPIELNNEIVHIQDYQKKYPAIFLFEWIEELQNVDKTKNIASKPKLNLFFMEEANVEDWDTADHYDKVINNMNFLALDFIKVCERSPYIIKVSEFKIIKRAKWGIWVKDKGNVRNILTDNMSGVELQITLEIDKIIDGCKLFDLYIGGGKPAPLPPLPTDATYTLINSEEDSIEVGIIPCGTTAIITAPDGIATVIDQNGGAITVKNIPSDTLKDITVDLNTDLTLAQKNLIAINGRIRSKIDVDANDYGSEFLVLPYINYFGHHIRLTGRTGGYKVGANYFDKDGVATTEALAFPDNVVLDHAQSPSNNPLIDVLVLKRTIGSIAMDWATSMATAAADTQLNLNWRLLWKREMDNLLLNHNNANFLGFDPFNNAIGASIWSGEEVVHKPTDAWFLLFSPVVTFGGKAGGRRYFACATYKFSNYEI